MHCTLLIPDLLPPSDLGAGPFADLRVPNIGTLLARGETAHRPPLASEDWLCEQFGVPTQPDRPLAALMLQADGGDPLHYYWLCAEPVQLRVDRNRLIVAARVADYTAAEANELVVALNRHFNSRRPRIHCADTVALVRAHGAGARPDDDAADAGVEPQQQASPAPRRRCARVARRDERSADDTAHPPGERRT
jgi:hypothetical protein